MYTYYASKQVKCITDLFSFLDEFPLKCVYLLYHLIGTGITSLVEKAYPSHPQHTHTHTHTSSFLQRWMFIGFSSSSSSALHRVLCLSSSRWTWYSSLLQSSSIMHSQMHTHIHCTWLHTMFHEVIIYLRSSMLETLLESEVLSLLILLTSSLRIRMSSSRWPYCTSPMLSVDCWILIFS